MTRGDLLRYRIAFALGRAARPRTSALRWPATWLLSSKTTATRGGCRKMRGRRAGRPLELRRVDQCPPSVLMQINVFRPQGN
jgi:hypothetical protein